MFYGYDAKEHLLEDPNEVVTDPYIGWASALWYYMTPQGDNKPSMHDVMTDWFEPNDADKA